MEDDSPVRDAGWGLVVLGLAADEVGRWGAGGLGSWQTRVFADEELQRLREFPEISREELFRYFTLSPADLAFVAPQGAGRG